MKEKLELIANRILAPCKPSTALTIVQAGFTVPDRRF
jgi:hypothetical protein